MKTTKFIIVSLLLLILTGCELPTLNAENLMRPPKASGDGAAIQAAMTELLGAQITYRYPRSGEYRSAVVLIDLDSDERNEAIAFYRNAAESSGAHMVLLDTDDRGKWSVVGEAESTGGDIDRVLFGDLNGDGILDIITGWSVYAGISVINAHSYSGRQLTAIPVVDTSEETGTRSAALYSEMAIGDFDGDGSDDILSAYINTADSSVTAQLLRYRSGSSGAEIDADSSADLYGSVAAYIGSSAGYISKNRFGLALDCLRRDGRYMTELIYWNSELSQLETQSATSEDQYTRTLSTLSADINDDGVIEFPTDELLPGYDADSAAPIYLTRWHTMSDSGQIENSISTVLFGEKGYFLITDRRWNGTITAQHDAISDVTYFCTAENGNPFACEVMRIKLFTLDEWDDVQAQSISILGEETTAPHYRELAATDYYVYAVLIACDDPRLGITFDTVQSNFRIMN